MENDSIFDIIAGPKKSMVQKHEYSLEFYALYLSAIREAIDAAHRLSITEHTQELKEIDSEVSLIVLNWYNRI